MNMFTSYSHIKKPKSNHGFFNDIIPGDVPLNIYFIDRKKVNPDLFGIEIRERYVHVYTTLLIC